VELGEEPVPVAVEVPLGDDGVARVRLRTDAAPLAPPADRWGDVRVRLGDLVVLDAGLER
jgi:hypothetical protein